MKINQLFKEKPPETLMLKVLNAFGLKSFNDKMMFCKADMVSRYNTIAALSNIKLELERYYIPCKARMYLSNINCKTALTILRQLLRLFAFELEIKQKYIKYKKIIYYSLRPLTDAVANSSNSQLSQIHFDKKVFRIYF